MPLEREWLAAGRFTAADIMMGDVLRQTFATGLTGYPVLHDYVDLLCARSAFRKAFDDQRAHFAAGDRARGA